MPASLQVRNKVYLSPGCSKIRARARISFVVRRVVTILNGHCRRVCGRSLCGNVYLLGPHHPQLQQATHKLAQTTRYENAKKITVFGTCTLIQNSLRQVCLSLYLNFCLTSCLILCLAVSIQGLLRRLTRQEISNLASRQSNTNKEFLRNDFLPLALNTAIQTASLGPTNLHKPERVSFIHSKTLNI